MTCLTVYVASDIFILLFFIIIVTAKNVIATFKLLI